MFKKITSLFVVFVFILVMIGGVCAAEDEKVYDVNYKEVNLYKSLVNYIKEYPTRYVNYNCNKGYKYYKTEVKINGTEYKDDMATPVILDSLGNYEIKVYNENNGHVFKTVKGKLTLDNNGVNVINAEFDNLVGTKCVYVFTIEVKENDTSTVDNETFVWEKVENSKLKWVNELKYGAYKNSEKSIINLGETESYSTSGDIFALGKTFFYYPNGNPGNLYFTKNQKLIVGDNFLETKSIAYPNKTSIKYWFKVEFVVNLSEQAQESESPEQTPEGTTVYEGKLPKTGETDYSTVYVTLGTLILLGGVSIGIYNKFVLGHKS